MFQDTGGDVVSRGDGWLLEGEVKHNCVTCTSELVLPGLPAPHGIPATQTPRKLAPHAVKIRGQEKEKRKKERKK